MDETSITTIQEGEHPFAKCNSLDKRRFLAAFVRIGQIGKAATSVGICPETHYRWRKNDPDYASAFEAAYEMASTMIEDAAVHRAVEGIEEGVYWRGEKVATERKYSDVLLAQQLNGRFPERYKYSRVDVNVRSLNIHVITTGEELPDGI